MMMRDCVVVGGQIRGLTFRAKLEAYERVRRKPQFQDHYMLDQERGTFDWPFLKVSSRKEEHTHGQKGRRRRALSCLPACLALSLG